jgi:16S rRNA G966 N2-methylase RsmD
LGNEPEGIKFTVDLKYNNLQFFLYLYYFLRSIALRGPLNTARLLGAEPRNEKFFRIKTAALKRSSSKEFYHYQGAGYIVLFRLFKEMFVTTRDIHFVDIGSGKGRAAFVAEYCGYSHVTGIELHKSLHEDALNNLKHYRFKRPGSVIRFINGNALEYGYRNEPTVYFLFNPFDQHVLEEVLGKILNSTTSETWFIYMNPKHDQAFKKYNIRKIKEFKTGLYTEAIIYRH